jgi:hypothetical protein
VYVYYQDHEQRNLARIIIISIIHPWDLGRTAWLLQLSFKFPGDFKRDPSFQTQRMIDIHVFDLAIVGNTFCNGYKQKRFKLKLDTVTDDSILCY